VPQSQNNINALYSESKGFILRKAGSHGIEELIPYRYSWAREYNSRLHTSLLGGFPQQRLSAFCALCYSF